MLRLSDLAAIDNVLDFEHYELQADGMPWISFHPIFRKHQSFDFCT